MLDVLWHAANVGTGRAAALRDPTFGKTGTAQDGRDSVFVGFAGNLVTAVWVGRDDNEPIAGNSGGHLPAQIWNSFMACADIGENDLPYIASGAPAALAPQRSVRETSAARAPVRVHRGGGNKGRKGKRGGKKR